MKTEALTTSESLALDVIRVTASAAVAFGHLTQKYFSTGWTDVTWIARCSVAIFFVLSGFVIRYVTSARPASLGGYLSDRASRIYSIALPALLLTLVADLTSQHVNPAFYAYWIKSSSHPLLRILVNLIFCGQIWNFSFEPLSNSPYWSVNYEVVYYFIYGCWFYLARNKRILWIAALCLFVGPRIIFLFPLWLAGAAAHDLYRKWTREGTAATYLNRALAVLFLALLFSLLPPVRSHARQITDRILIRTSFLPWNGTLAPFDYLFGFAWIVVFLRILLTARSFTIRPKTNFVRTVRFISEGTFPLYLIHFPLYVLIAACIPYDHASSAEKLAIYLSVVSLGIVAGHPGNLLKNQLRSFFFAVYAGKKGKPTLI